MSLYSHIQLLDGGNMVSNCMILFHDYCLVLLLMILTYVCFMFYICYSGQSFVTYISGGSNFLEMVWTILPMFFLLSLGVPSFLMMYYVEGELKGDLTVKSIGHQWYWSYESSDFSDYQVDSYMLGLSDLSISSHRLMEVDNSLVLPYLTKVRMVVTSTDVLHAWALPSMCIKMDAVPGRLNTLNVFSMTPGSFYGQCSEICGINHSFMPIHVEFVDWANFLNSVL
uniref:Cytochrome c oxidase subunit 2 n=1 Tax=Rhopalaea idoneta TaxID=1712670 RepID=A0A173QSX6_9ASCI|nr:cytochrome c oxidase subunit II [Rhopalaea idoneta]